MNKHQEQLPNRPQIRILFAVLLAAAALLLLGAGRLGDSMEARQTAREQVRTEWKNTVNHLLPVHNGLNTADSSIRNLAEHHPEYLLQALHRNLQPEAAP